MDFDLSEDQTMLKESVERLFAAAAGSPALWTSMAEMGLLAAPFPEAQGGLGLGAVETMVIAEAAGRALAVSPYGGSIVAAGTVLRLAPMPPIDQITAVAAGDRQVAWAHDEAGRDVDLTRTVAAVAGGEGWILSGTKTHVGHVTPETWLMVTASADGEPAVLLVPPGAPGVRRRDYRLIDASPASEVTFTQTPVGTEALLARGPQAAMIIERAREHLVAYLGAEAVGLMQAMLDATLEHLKTRRQFGQTLSQFQALRHKAAEMLVALEQARSMVMFAALSVDDADTEGRRKAIRQVRSVVAKSSRFVAQTAVQLHGGVGVTEEHPVGRAFRRLTLIDLEMERG
jgi:alkylation response protein AidB-like acyl-CoA dehydrogenase